MRQLRILFADGKQHVRDHFLSLFAPARYEAVAARDCKHLAELCRTFRPDVIIADEQLPDGPVLAATAVARECQTAIIVLAAAVGPALLRQVEEEPLIMSCLIKPVNPAELEAAARIAGRRSQELRAAVAAAPQSAAEGHVLRRAERVMMKRAGVNAEEAQRRLRDMASARSLNLHDLAHVILSAEEAFTFCTHHADEAAVGCISAAPRKVLAPRPRSARDTRAQGVADATAPVRLSGDEVARPH